MARSGNCSELEYMVMAMIAVNVTSGYAMRKYIIALRGTRWSTESGSIYRALQRLLAANLIEESGKAGSPNRQRTDYRVSSTGSKLLNLWMCSAIDQDLAEVLDDPVRARASFLKLIPFGDRREVVGSWISDSKSLLEKSESDIAKLNQNEKSFESLIVTGYRIQIQARIEWLETVRATL